MQIESAYKSMFKEAMFCKFKYKTLTVDMYTLNTQVHDVSFFLNSVTKLYLNSFKTEYYRTHVLLVQEVSVDSFNYLLNGSGYDNKQEILMEFRNSRSPSMIYVS